MIKLHEIEVIKTEEIDGSFLNPSFTIYTGKFKGKILDFVPLNINTPTKEDSEMEVYCPCDFFGHYYPEDEDGFASEVCGNCGESI